MRINLVRLLSRSASVLLALTFTFSIAQAQFTSAIEGTVSDPSGAVVPKAAVTIKSSSTGIERTVETSESGYFRISSLPAATFTITIKANGFKTTQQEITPGSGPDQDLECRAGGGGANGGSDRDDRSASDRIRPGVGLQPD